MKTRFAPIALAFALAGSISVPFITAATAEDKVVATINGKAITDADLAVTATVAALGAAAGETLPVRRALTVALGVGLLVAAATYVQFSGKCPRCSTRLGRQARLVLPERCRVCGVEFPKP